MVVAGTAVSGGALTVPLLLATSSKALSGLAKLIKILIPGDDQRTGDIQAEPADRADEIFYVFAQRAFLKALGKLKGRIPSTKQVGKDKHAELVRVIELSVVKPEMAEASFAFGWKRDASPLPLFESYRVWLGALLTAMGVEKNHVDSLVTEVVKEARSNLHKELVSRTRDREWMVHYQLLENTADILSLLDGFFPTAQLDSAWAHYLADLTAKPKLPIWGEEDQGLNISQLFVEPGYEYHRQDFDGLCSVGAPEGYVGLKAFLLGLLSHRRPSTELVFVMGGPGTGKTSLMEVFSAELAATAAAKIVLLPAKKINPSRSLLAEIQRNMSEMGYGSIADTLVSTDDCIIAIDGFDELAHATLSTLDNFFRSAQDLVKDRVASRLRIILSGRPTLFAANDVTIPPGSHVVTLKPFDSAQVQAWSHNWRQATQGSFDGSVYLASDSEDLRDLATQPMLLYLLAKMHEAGEAIPQNLTQTRGVRFQVYARILDWVCRRQEEKRVPSALSARMRRFLQIAGLATHQSGQRTLHWKHFSRALAVAGLADDPTEMDAKVHSTILAFAFTTVEERAWEFTHKSFGEALAAEAIGRVLEDMAEPGRDGEPWRMPLPAATKLWIETFGPHFLTKDVLDFCRGWLQVKGAVFPTTFFPRLLDILSSVLGSSSSDTLASVATITERPSHTVLGNSVRSWFALANAHLALIVDDRGTDAILEWKDAIGADQFRTAIYLSAIVAPFSQGESEALLGLVSNLVRDRANGASERYLTTLIKVWQQFQAVTPKHRGKRDMWLHSGVEYDLLTPSTSKHLLTASAYRIIMREAETRYPLAPLDQLFNELESTFRHGYEPSPLEPALRAAEASLPVGTSEEVARVSSALAEQVERLAGSHRNIFVDFFQPDLFLRR